VEGKQEDACHCSASHLQSRIFHRFPGPEGSLLIPLARTVSLTSLRGLPGPSFPSSTLWVRFLGLGVEHGYLHTMHHLFHYWFDFLYTAACIRWAALLDSHPWHPVPCISLLRISEGTTVGRGMRSWIPKYFEYPRFYFPFPFFLLTPFNFYENNSHPLLKLAVLS
jgi:hypothetical protein